MSYFWGKILIKLISNIIKSIVIVLLPLLFYTDEIMVILLSVVTTIFSTAVFSPLCFSLPRLHGEYKERLFIEVKLLRKEIGFHFIEPFNVGFDRYALKEEVRTKCKYLSRVGYFKSIVVETPSLVKKNNDCRPKLCMFIEKVMQFEKEVIVVTSMSKRSFWNLNCFVLSFKAWLSGKKNINTMVYYEIKAVFYNDTIADFG